MDIREALKGIGVTVNEKHVGRFDKDLNLLERNTGFKLPDDYRFMFNQLLGLSLGPLIFDFHLNHDPIMRIGNKIRLFNSVVTPERAGLMEQYKYIQEIIKDEFEPNKLLPIGLINDEHLLLLDFRSGETPSLIALIDDFVFVARSITDWLEKMIDHGLYRRLLVVSYARTLRAVDNFEYFKDEFKPLKDRVERIVSHMLSEEASVVIQNSDRYLGMGLELGVEDMLSNEMLPDYGLHQADVKDLTWAADANENRQIMWDITAAEKRFGIKYEDAYKSMVMNFNGLTPAYENKISLWAEGCQQMAEIEFLPMSKIVAGEESEIVAAQAHLDALREKASSEEIKTIVSTFVPFAKIKGEYPGYVCFEKSEDGAVKGVTAFFNYKTGPNAHEVWSLLPLAINFEDFVSGLYWDMKLNFIRVKQAVSALESPFMEEEMANYLIKGVEDIILDSKGVHRDLYDTTDVSLNEKMVEIFGGYHQTSLML